jgi:hypothetical protein
MQKGVLNKYWGGFSLNPYHFVYFLWPNYAWFKRLYLCTDVQECNYCLNWELAVIAVYWKTQYTVCVENVEIVNVKAGCT